MAEGLELFISSERAVQAARQFTDAVNRAAGAADRVGTQLDRFQKEIDQTGTSADRTGPSVRQMGRSAEEAGSRAERSSRSMRKLTQETTAAGAAARVARRQLTTLLGTVAAAASIQRGVRAFAEYEDRLQILGVISGATGRELGELESAAVQTSLALRRFTPGETIGGLTELARAGLNTQQSIEAIRPTADLARVGLISMADSAAIVSRTLTQFNLDATEAGRVADVLAVAADSSNSEVSSLAEALAKAAPGAAQLGVPLEEVVAVLARLADLTPQAAIAGRAVKTFSVLLSELETAGSDAKAALGELGLSFDQVDVRSQGLLGVLRNLRDANLDLSAAVRLVGIEFGGQLAQSVDNIEIIDRNFESLGESVGQASEKAKAGLESLSATFTDLSSSAQLFAVSLGDGGLGKSLTGLVQFSADVLKSLSGQQDAMRDVGLAATVTARAIEALAIGYGALGAIKLAAILAATTREMIAFATASRVSATAVAAFGASAATTSKSVLALGGVLKALGIGLVIGGAIELASALIDSANAAEEAEDSIADATVSLRQFIELRDGVEGAALAMARYDQEIQNVQASALQVRSILDNIAEGFSADSARESAEKFTAAIEAQEAQLERLASQFRDLQREGKETVRVLDILGELGREDLADLAKSAETEAFLGFKEEDIRDLETLRRILGDVQVVAGKLVLPFGEVLDLVQRQRDVTKEIRDLNQQTVTSSIQTATERLEEFRAIAIDALQPFMDLRDLIDAIDAQKFDPIVDQLQALANTTGISDDIDKLSESSQNASVFVDRLRERFGDLQLQGGRLVITTRDYQRAVTGAVTAQQAFVNALRSGLDPQNARGYAQQVTQISALRDAAVASQQAFVSLSDAAKSLGTDAKVSELVSEFQDLVRAQQEAGNVVSLESITASSDRARKIVSQLSKEFGNVEIQAGRVVIPLQQQIDLFDQLLAKIREAAGVQERSAQVDVGGDLKQILSDEEARASLLLESEETQRRETVLARIKSRVGRELVGEELRRAKATADVVTKAAEELDTRRETAAAQRRARVDADRDAAREERRLESVAEATRLAQQELEILKLRGDERIRQKAVFDAENQARKLGLDLASEEYQLLLKANKARAEDDIEDRNRGRSRGGGTDVEQLFRDLESERELAGLVGDEYEQLAREIRAANEARSLGLEGDVAAQFIRERVAIDELEEATRRAADAGAELGSRFGEALNRIIVGGERSSDVIRQLLIQLSSQQLTEALSQFGQFLFTARSNQPPPPIKPGASPPTGPGGLMGAVLPAQSGRIIDEPQLLLRAGKLISVAEGGKSTPEGIFPLVRDSRGRLGVSAEGSGGGTFIMNFPSVRTRRDATSLRPTAEQIARRAMQAARPKRGVRP